MRKTMYVLVGLLLFAGAATLLYSRQMQVAGDGPAAMSPSEPKSATRSLRPDNGERRALRRERRIDRGLRQYQRDDGSWQMFEAVIDVLNVVVGMVGIGLAINGMRARRSA